MSDYTHDRNGEFAECYRQTASNCRLSRELDRLSAAYDENHVQGVCYHHATIDPTVLYIISNKNGRLYDEITNGWTPEQIDTSMNNVDWGEVMQMKGPSELSYEELDRDHREDLYNDIVSGRFEMPSNVEIGLRLEEREIRDYLRTHNNRLM